MASVHPDPAQHSNLLDVRARLSEQEYLLAVVLDPEDAKPGIVVPPFYETIKRDIYPAVFLPKITAFFQEYIQKSTDEVKFAHLSLGGKDLPLNQQFGMIYTQHGELDRPAPLSMVAKFSGTPSTYQFLQDTSTVEHLNIKDKKSQLQADEIMLRMTLLQDMEQSKDGDDRMTVLGSISPNSPDFAISLERAATLVLKTSITEYKKYNFEKLIERNLDDFIRDSFFYGWKESFLIKTNLPSYIRQNLDSGFYSRFFELIKTQNIKALTSIIEDLFSKLTKDQKKDFSPFKFLVKIFVENAKAWVTRCTTDDGTLTEFLKVNFPLAESTGLRPVVSTMGIPLPLDSKMVDISAMFSFIDHILYLRVKWG